MKLKTKHGELNTEMLGFVVSRINTHGVEPGKIYPYGLNADGSLTIVDGAGDKNTLGKSDVIFLHDNTKLAVIGTTYPNHRIFGGEIVEYKLVRPGRKINDNCLWVKSQYDDTYFAVRGNKLTEYFPRWTGVAYRHRMQSVQPEQEKLIGAGTITRLPGSVAKFEAFTPEERINRYVTVEFNKGGKQYTYLLPNHLTAVAGDDAVVVVNNPNYPELKGTKVVRVTGVYTRDPSDYDNALKTVEHIVSKSAERRKELEQKINDKRIQLQQANKRVAAMTDQLFQLEEDLANGTY